MNLEQLEREKYERIWKRPDYHKYSPGEYLVPYFFKNVPVKPGESIIDLGCGTGREGCELSRGGLEVFLMDHVNALESHIELPFILGNLWEPPEMFGFDWFYCCDVMEHMPPEKVDAVLDNIAKISTKGGFFQIALFPSVWAGEVLHLTIESTEWWTAKIKQRWPHVRTDNPEKGRLVAIVEN